MPRSYIVSRNYKQPDTEIKGNNRHYLIDTLTEFPDIYRVKSLDTFLERAKDAG